MRLSEKSKELFICPCILVKINIVHLVFVGIHEQEISASSAELFEGDPQLYLSIKLLTHCYNIIKLYQILMKLCKLINFWNSYCK